MMRAWVCLIALALSFLGPPAFAASEHHGQVTFHGLPVPGATVTATQGNKRLVAITDQQGVYTFMDLDDGQWKFQVEMLGFATQTQDIAITADAPAPMWELKLLPLEEITRGLEPVNTVSAETPSPPAAANGKTPAAAAPPASKSGGFQRATVNSAAASAAPPPAAANDASSTSSESSENAAPGLLVNGSVNNGAASAFSQIAAFGNNRKGPGSLYNGGLGVIFDTSSWDAAPFSVTGLATPKPSYNDVQIVSALGGPLGIPSHLIRNANFFVSYQHQANDNAITLPGRVPTLLERGGNLSQTLNPATGQPVQIYNPATNVLFPGSVVPVSPQAQALLTEYPLPNVSTPGAYNYEAPVLSSSQQDGVQTRVTKNSSRNQFFGNLAYQRQAAQTTSIFGFTDATNTSGLDSAVNWSHYYRPGGTSFLSVHFKYEFSRFASNVTPYFANRANVSGDAGIVGNDQTPTSWGPPNLLFSTGVAGLSEPQFARDVNQTQAFTYDSLWNRGHHNFQWGGDTRRQQFNVRSQQNARGAFTFTGADTQEMSGGVPVPGTGSDLADFLLGVPDAVGISFGNADKYLRGWSYDAFINDDWRMKSGLTLNVGLRWEFATPLTEVHDRLANLDIAPGFTAAVPVVASNPAGPITGQTYPNSLLRPDFRGFEPRLGLAWRPRANSPLVIRAGYGIYDNTGVYPTIGTLLAEQPPFTKTLSIQNSIADPLTLATAFNAAPPGTPNTFAANPDFRIGYAQNWDVSVQQDLPGSLVMTATYLGTKGTRLMQEFLPNTFPLGATNPCPTCPAGFVYLDSNGDSTREAGQIQLRRRLRDGLTATVQYTYAKAIDDASAFSGTGLTTVSMSAANPATGTTGAGSGNPTTPTPSPSIAQNWLNLRAERGPSTFDQRNLLNFQMQYTTGAGIRGGALLAGRKGALLKEWTVTAQLTAGDGLPLTPVYLTNVTGTAVTGTVRPDYTGAPVREAPAGLFLNPAAYTAPAPGQWGDAGRDSIVGPTIFSLNASIGRTFRLGSRLFADWQMNATNVLNNVTYTSWNTTVTSPLFGLPNQANTMRKLQTSVRVRF